MPAYVPNSLQTLQQQANGEGNLLAKPILFDCDYQYEANEDLRLTVKWFKNKDPEPFYQWLPELNVRHFADWLKPLVDANFVSDPHDSLKRYRSLLIRRLSMNLTGQYTCLVSSLAGQDMRQANLVVYQPPRAFNFEHRIYPAAAALLAAAPPSAAAVAATSNAQATPLQRPQLAPLRPSPTQFRGANWPQVAQTSAQSNQAVVRPANNNNNNQVHSANHSSQLAATKIVYTHDGRPIRRKSRRDTLNVGEGISTWQLNKRLISASSSAAAGQFGETGAAIQLHHFQCHASQVTPRPVLVLTVKRGADSIAQYLHESSSLAIRPYSEPSDSSVTLYDATVSATVALNVSLPAAGGGQVAGNVGQQQQPPTGINTILNFRRGQRMSFECHLELTGTEFEQRKRINIDEEGKPTHSFAGERLPPPAG